MTNKNDILRELDRIIISNNDYLENGETIVIKTADGYLMVKKEYDNQQKTFVTSTFFNEFDDYLNCDFKQILMQEDK